MSPLSKQQMHTASACLGMVPKDRIGREEQDLDRLENEFPNQPQLKAPVLDWDDDGECRKDPPTLRPSG